MKTSRATQIYLTLEEKMKIYNKVNDEVLKESPFDSFMEMNIEQATKYANIIEFKLSQIKNY